MTVFFNFHPTGPPGIAQNYITASMASPHLGLVNEDRLIGTICRRLIPGSRGKECTRANNYSASWLVYE